MVPIPISKKCRLCKTVKLLNEFEFNEKKKDKHGTICKDCIAKHQPSIRSCSCDRWENHKDSILVDGIVAKSNGKRPEASRRNVDVDS